MDLLVDLLASVIFAGLGALSFRFAYLPLKRRSNAMSRLLPLDFEKRSPVVICYGLVERGHSGKYYMVEEGDLGAITLLHEIAVEVYGRPRVRTFNYLATEGRLSEISNLLCVSGPRWNRVTEEYIGRIGSPATFDRDKESIVITTPNGESEWLAAEYRPTGDPDVCYGFVVSGYVKAADGKRQNVCICAGINNISTYGSVLFLRSLQGQRFIRKLGLPGVKPRHNWAVVLRVQNTTNPENFELHHTPIGPNRISVEIERVIDGSQFLKPYRYRY